MQLRLLDLAAGTVRVLAEGTGDSGETGSVTNVVLRYPWVVWRQVSEETYFYAWTGWKMNIETGEKREINWLAYGDHRDGTDQWSDTDREQNTYALHLPSRTEICVENWNGYQLGVEVYEGVGETRVLFFHEIAFGMADDLWDCNLPVPRSEGS